VPETVSPYLQAAIKEMIAFTSIQTVKGVCTLGAIGWANMWICAEAALMHQVVCRLPGVAEEERVSV